MICIEAYFVTSRLLKLLHRPCNNNQNCIPITFSAFFVINLFCTYQELLNELKHFPQFFFISMFSSDSISDTLEFFFHFFRIVVRIALHRESFKEAATVLMSALERQPVPYDDTCV